MDLLIIPVLLSLGGGLLYLSLNGAPRVSFEKVPFGFRRDPFKLNDWMSRRPARSRGGKRISAEDAELVELMNDMIAVREQLTDLRLARAPRPIRRRNAPARKTANTATVTVEVNVELEEPEPAASQPKDERPAETPAVAAPARREQRVEAKPVLAEQQPPLKAVAVKETPVKLPQPVKAVSEAPAPPKQLLQPMPNAPVKKPVVEPKPVAKAPEPPKAEKALADRPAVERPNSARRPAGGHSRRYVRV